MGGLRISQAPMAQRVPERIAALHAQGLSIQHIRQQLRMAYGTAWNDVQTAQDHRWVTPSTLGPDVLEMGTDALSRGARCEGAVWMNSLHDVGGMDGFGPVEREENEPVFHEPWEAHMRAIDALMLKKLHAYCVDETRHRIERINPVYYLGSSYYQIWLLRMESLLIEKGYVTEVEVQAKMREITPEPPTSHLAPYRHIMPSIASARRRTVIPNAGSENKDDPIPTYAVGDVVRVKDGAPLGHTRVPRYVRGKVGVITNLHGNFILPDQRVENGSKLYQPVYRVCFEAQHVWGADASPQDKLYLEMWEDYIEPEGRRA